MLLNHIILLVVFGASVVSCQNSEQNDTTDGLPELLNDENVSAVNTRSQDINTFNLEQESDDLNQELQARSQSNAVNYAKAYNLNRQNINPIKRSKKEESVQNQNTNNVYVNNPQKDREFLKLMLDNNNNILKQKQICRRQCDDNNNNILDDDNNNNNNNNNKKFQRMLDDYNSNNNRMNINDRMYRDNNNNNNNNNNNIGLDSLESFYRDNISNDNKNNNDVPQNDLVPDLNNNNNINEDMNNNEVSGRGLLRKVLYNRYVPYDYNSNKNMKRKMYNMMDNDNNYKNRNSYNWKNHQMTYQENPYEPYYQQGYA